MKNTIFNDYTNDIIAALMLSDGYKTGHHKMYPQGTEEVYSNFTPRSNRHAPEGFAKVLSFGQQMTARKIVVMFNKGFFNLPKHTVCQYIKEEFSMYLGFDYDVSHFERLHDLGYLPLRIKALPEGTLVPMNVPVLTVRNTRKDFFWLTNFLETIISELLWKPMTSATIAYLYRRDLEKWVLKTDPAAVGFVKFQGHDFSMRGMDSIFATMSSGLGHACSFLGSDSLPVIPAARMYYDAIGPVIHSVNATEHSVMCAGGNEEGDELTTFRYLMDQFPNGILSIVSDTWNLWYVITYILVQLKDEIIARGETGGKIVIRPDSGNPVDIICGTRGVIQYPTFHQNILNNENLLDAIILGELDLNRSSIFSFNNELYKFNHQYSIDEETGHDPCCFNESFEKLIGDQLSESLGVIELLWDIFGGTINEQGYKVLAPCIGAIYGDAITLERQKSICERLEAKGFASTNVIFGIGSFTYQYNTRDSFGFAMKATHVYLRSLKMDGHSKLEGRQIFKDPATGDGRKKSAKGLLSVLACEECGYKLLNNCTEEEEATGMLQTIFEDGTFYNEITLMEIRSKVDELVNKYCR